MKQQARIALLFLFIGFTISVVAAPIGKKTKTSFDKALPEDISNKNFPDIIESFDYPDANILDLVKAIGKLTGLNFIIDPSLSSKKITVIAPSKITIAEAYKAFLSALAINGYTLVKSGAFWKIQETKKALKDNTEIYSGDYFPNTDQLITRIIKLQYIDAKEFSDSIKYLLSQNNQISHHTSSNSVIISDYGSVIERIMKIVYTMDTPGSEETIEVIPMQHAAAEDISNMLSNLLSIKSPRSSRQRRSLISKNTKVGNVKISSIVSDLRTNSVVVSANKEGLIRVKELVNKLDTYIDPSRTGGIYVYNVLYGTAEQVYNTLMGIEGTRSSKRNNSRRGYPFHFSGSSSSSRSGNFSNKAKTSPLFENVTILADINTNSLIISAKNKYDFERVKEVLKKIDVPRDQVFVQAIIVEMLVDQGDQWEANLVKTLGKSLSGLLPEWLSFLNVGGTPIAGFLNRSFSADPSFLQKSKLGPGLVLGLPLKDFLQSNGLGGVGGSQSNRSASIEDFLDKNRNLPESSLNIALNSYKDESRGLNSSSINQAINYTAFPLLQLLKKAGNVNVLSTPQITALDNITASIEVGENAPVGIVNTTSAVAVSQNSVDRQDVTLKLEITPRINPDSGTVQMDISQKFDDFSERQSPASELQSKGVHIVKRNIETKMVLHDGETAVLGGLLTDRETRSENKIPILGDIPVLGWLFKGFTVRKDKRNLIVFITPTIIRGKNQKKQIRKLLSKKLEERIYFIRKNMKGSDPHGSYLKEMTAKANLQINEDAESPVEEEFSNGQEQLTPEDFEPALSPSIESPVEKPSSALPKIDVFELESSVDRDQGEESLPNLDEKEQTEDFMNFENEDKQESVQTEESLSEEEKEQDEDESDEDESEEDEFEDLKAEESASDEDDSVLKDEGLSQPEETIDIFKLDEDSSNDKKDSLE